jgi:hypothetical protein
MVTYDAAMEKQSGQFGIFDLFVLMTAAALAFAIVRLPLPAIGKFIAVLMIAICFYGWAVRNRKYPDPRVPLPQLAVRRRRLGIVMNLIIWSMLSMHLVRSYMRIRPHTFAAADALIWITVPLGLAIVIWSSVRRW